MSWFGATQGSWYGSWYGGLSERERENHGGGWHHHKHRKPLRQLKKEYYVLPYTLLEEQKLHVSDVLEELLAKLARTLDKLKQDFNLGAIIAALQEEIAYEKLKLEAIEYTERRKEQAAKNRIREQDISMIAIYMMDDDD